MRSAAALLVFVTLGCSSSSSPPRPQPEPASDPPRPPLFELRVGFWVNLHQRLYAESDPRPPPDPLQLASADDQAIWDRAVEQYRGRYPDRAFLTLLTDDDLVRTNRELARLPAGAALASSAVPPELAAALEAAAPVYRRHGWPLDEQAGDRFRQRLAPLLERHGRALAAAHGEAYATPWPAQPIPVDIAAYAGPVAAYTVLAPTHVTIASADPRHAGELALEILFHEASHGLVRPIEEAIGRACAAQHRTVPQKLWHLVLFYTTGELVRRQLGPGYTPYAYQHGLYGRDPEGTAAEAQLARHWGDYLDGRATLDEAVGRIVAGMPDSRGGAAP